MGLEKVGTTIGKEIIALTRTCNTRVFASNPVNIKGLNYAFKLKGDAVQIARPLKSASVPNILTNMTENLSSEFSNIDSALVNEISKLMLDNEVDNKKGIYLYVLTRKIKYLSLRQFDDNIKRQQYEKQKGICPHCVAEHREKIHFEYEEMEGDHITPWIEGGKTIIENCQMLCREHNRLKSSK